MPGFKQQFVQPITEASSEQRDDLGDIQWRGDLAYKYIQWQVGEATAVVGEVCMYIINLPTAIIVEKSTGAYPAAGINQAALVAEEYGWIQIKGITIVSFDTGSNGINTSLTTSGAVNGKLVTINGLGEPPCAIQGIPNSDVIFCDFPF